MEYYQASCSTQRRRRKIRRATISSSDSDAHEGIQNRDGTAPRNSDSGGAAVSSRNSDANEQDGAHSADESGHELDNGVQSHSESSIHSNSDDDSASSVSSDSENDLDDNAQPLYAGAPITLGESIVAILMLALRHKITGACLADVLALIALHCIRPNRCLKTLYRFKQYFKNIGGIIIRHFYCTECCTKLATKSSICNYCHEHKGISYFIEIPIIPQLATFFKRPGFFAKLNHRFTRAKIVPTNYEDIYDGRVYRSLSNAGGILSHQSNISFTWNSDGVPLFKSSKYSIWPFFLMINELPYALRTKKDNVLLAGLWFGPKKPQANMFLDSFRESFADLYRGVPFEIHGSNAVERVRGILVCGSCDLPATAQFLNMQQYNGTYGCHTCMQRSERAARNVRVYRYQENVPLRTTAETNNFARQAYHSRKTVFGIKGPTTLSQIAHDYIQTTTIDTMHCVYLGITKKLLQLWFDSRYHDRPWSLREFIDSLDNQIRNIRPPSFVQRLPRKIADIAYWKASELKVWLLYHSIPLVNTIMLPRYFNHHKLLVHGINLLNQGSISEEMIVEASQCLTEYVARFEDLYGLRHMSCNVHQLLHLADVVRKFGPLFITSCFTFENLNGLLKSFVHGTRYADLQITSAAMLFQSLAKLKHDSLMPESDVYNFCHKLELTSARRRRVLRIVENIFIVGKERIIDTLPHCIRQAFVFSGRRCDDSHKYYEFKRLYKNGTLFDSHSYMRTRKTNSAFVEYVSNGLSYIGMIETFIRICCCDCERRCDNCINNSRSYAILKRCIAVRPFTGLLAGTTLESVFRCVILDDESMNAIDVESLLCVCFNIEIPDSQQVYVIKPVNSLESE